MTRKPWTVDSGHRCILCTQRQTQRRWYNRINACMHVRTSTLWNTFSLHFVCPCVCVQVSVYMSTSVCLVWTAHGSLIESNFNILCWRLLLVIFWQLSTLRLDFDFVFLSVCLSVGQSEGLKEETKQLLSGGKKKGKGGGKNDVAKEEEPKSDSQPVVIQLCFKRYIFDPKKRMVQSWPMVQARVRSRRTILE